MESSMYSIVVIVDKLAAEGGVTITEIDGFYDVEMADRAAARIASNDRYGMKIFTIVIQKQ